MGYAPAASTCTVNSAAAYRLVDSLQKLSGSHVGGKGAGGIGGLLFVWDAVNNSAGSKQYHAAYDGVQMLTRQRSFHDDLGAVGLVARRAPLSLQVSGRGSGPPRRRGAVPCAGLRGRGDNVSTGHPAEPERSGPGTVTCARRGAAGHPGVS
jgi:hypothetical protein